MEKPIKMCAFPGCKNRGASKGKNSNGIMQSKWCNFHRKLGGKKARLDLIQNEKTGS